MRLDVKERVAHLENGKSVAYDKCLIATGIVVNFFNVKFIITELPGMLTSSDHNRFLIKFFRCWEDC